MEQTLDYSIFGSILSNREVDVKHVNRLVIAIRKKNLLHINPIICNNNFEVVDGQHRLEAARVLKIPVYYIVDEEVSKHDIATINTNSKNWTSMDYINYWTIEKREGFDRLSSFLATNPLISPSTALMMLSATRKRSIDDLKNGHVDLSSYDNACKVALVIKYFFNIVNWAYERFFVMALITMVSHPEYDHEIMKTKLEFQSRSLVKCINTKQYLELLQEIYNYRSSKNLIKF